MGVASDQEEPGLASPHEPDEWVGPDAAPRPRNAAAVVGTLLLVAGVALGVGYAAGRGRGVDLTAEARASTVVASHLAPVEAGDSLTAAPPIAAAPVSDDTSGLSFGLVQEGVVSIGEPAPPFSLPGVRGEQISLTDYAGKPILLNFFATWCVPCRAEMPHLQAAYAEHSTDGLVVLGVDVQEGAELVAPFMDELGLTFPAVLDATGEVSVGTYRVGTLPTSVLIDRDGEVALITRRYYAGREDVEADLRFILVD